MKEFDLEVAKKGAPVCTRDGRDVKILDYDYHRVDCDEHFIIAKYPAMSGKGEVAVMYTQNGKMYHGDDDDKDKDLMLKGVKHKGFVNIYRDEMFCRHPYYHALIAKTFEQAQAFGIVRQDYIATIEIEWED